MILTFIQKKKIYLFTTEHQQILIPEFNVIKSPYISIIWPLDHSHPMDGAPRPKVTRKPLQYPTIRVNPTSENFTQENPTCESQETRIFHLVRSVPRSLKGFSRTYQRNFEARVSVRKFLAPNQPISSTCPCMPPSLFHVTGLIRFLSRNEAILLERRAAMATHQESNNPLLGYYHGVRRSH